MRQYTEVPPNRTGYKWTQYGDEPLSCDCIYDILEIDDPLLCWAGCPNCFGYGFPPIPPQEVGIKSVYDASEHYEDM